MPGDLTGSAVFASWYVDWPALGLVAVVAVLYLAGASRFARRDAGPEGAPSEGMRWPVHRSVFFLLGLAMFVWVTMSFLATYQQVLFWPRAVQVITLLMVVPLLLALGSPVRLAVEAGPAWLARAVTAVLRARLAALATFPAVVSLAFLATPFVVYFSPIYQATLESRGAAWVLSFALVAVGFFYYWTRLRLDPVPKEYPHLVSVWITFAEAVADGALGLTLMMGHHLVSGDWYTSAARLRTWGPTPHQDQVWGGGALWLIGDLAGVPFIGALWRRMFDEDRERAAAVDAELDALEAEAAAGSPARTSGSSASSMTSAPDSDEPSVPLGHSAQEEAQRLRPWWETDPVIGARMGFLERE
jgi:cytochrome c oxidase assembly factor CtaG